MAAEVSPARAWYAVGLLTTAYVVSFIDRSVLALLVGPIRDDLGISDTQFSLLHGLAFAIFYTFMGIPVARMADRYSRRLIIGIGVFVWSVMTALGGLSRSYAQLFLSRVGVGVGEATLSPAAYTLMADMFDPSRLGRATGIYGAGVYIGTGISFTVGGWLIDTLTAAGPVTLPLVGTLQPWQQMLLIAGSPGLVLALAMVTLPDPPRRRRDAAPELSRPHGPAADSPGTPDIGLLAYLRRDAFFLATLLAGAALVAIIFNGYLGWGAEYFVREHGWSKTDAGLALGLMIVLAGSAGVISGGLITDAITSRGGSHPALRAVLVGAIGVMPWPLLATTTADPVISLLGFAPLIFFASLVFTPVVVVLQMRAPSYLRAQIAAIYLFVANLVGIGMGTTVMAMVSDYLLGGTQLGLAMASVGVLSGLAGTGAFWLCFRDQQRRSVQAG